MSAEHRDDLPSTSEDGAFQGYAHVSVRGGGQTCMTLEQFHAAIAATSTPIPLAPHPDDMKPTHADEPIVVDQPGMTHGFKVEPLIEQVDKKTETSAIERNLKAMRDSQGKTLDNLTKTILAGVP